MDTHTGRCETHVQWLAVHNSIQRPPDNNGKLKKNVVRNKLFLLFAQHATETGVGQQIKRKKIVVKNLGCVDTKQRVHFFNHTSPQEVLTH